MASLDMQDYVVSQRRRNSARLAAGMYSQPTNGVQTVVTTDDVPEATSGGRSYAFWLLVAVVLLVAIFNLLITLTLISVLRISVGMESVQVVKGGMVLPGTVDMDRLYKPDGSFLGFADDPMSINGVGGTVDLVVSAGGRDDADGPRLSLAGAGVLVQGVARAGVSQAGAVPFFNTAYPNFGLPAGVRSLRVQDARTRRVVSPVDRSLKLLSSKQAHLKGSEGTHVDGKEIVFSADQELHLKSVNGSVVLMGADGVRLDVRGIPWAQGRSVSDGTRAAYRLCTCMPRVTCANAALHGDNNPCA
ncbi:LOW QUALITY PROTEIN: beta-sarcoglycan-like [Pollicipes pollicipes]|uniref:LOW QUALITY PROTEIN: beta-sarcoglycan-like n=1 Tax=Pollicipes pollicipes TaxID=41117 RepID=UPI001885769D|nr:LOW QUALITY PROTEIN: beta-sarcoglycan-like [Pollicipes pollicipes]